ARDFIGAAQSQMRILENQMSFQNLKQGARRVRLNPRVTVSALACFSLREVIVNCLPLKAKKAEKRKLKLIPRFFAYIVKVDPITEVQTREYKWIYFNNKKDSVDLNITEKHWSRFNLNGTYEFLIRKTKNPNLERMKNTPRGDILHPNPHRNTKAFMMDGRTTEERENDLDEFGDPIDRPERWVSAGHLLTKDRKSMFMPLHAFTDDNNNQYSIVGDDDYCDILDSAKYPDYPLPFPDSLFLAYKNNLLFTGLQFPVPPRHFYCNTEKGIMIWYGTNIDYAYDAGDYIGGIIYSRRTRRFHNFMIYPTEANGHGYELCYQLYYGHSELPQNLMADVQSLDDEYLKVAMSWNKRPIEYKFSLAAGNTVTSEITSVTHVRWVKDGTGFEHQPLTEWTQYDIDPPVDERSDSVPNPYEEGDTSPCKPREDCVCQGFEDGGDYKYAGGTIYGLVDTQTRHSDQTWDLLGVNVKLIVDVRRQIVDERCMNRVVRCLTVEGTLCGIHTHEYSKMRQVQEVLLQQESDDCRGYWTGNNSLGFEYRKHRKYMDAEAWTHAFSETPSGVLEGYFPQCYKAVCDYFPTESDFNARCTWCKNCPPDYINDSGFTFPCFYEMENDEMRGDDWITIESDTIYFDGFSGFWAWLRESDIDSYDYTVKDEFNVDGEITFSFDDVDNIYYLDDRATDDNQGLIAAGRGLSDTELYSDDCLGVTEYKPDYWKIYWKIQWDEKDTEDMEYLDITEKLLEALGCEDHELIDLGLI
ncbi:MAG: hypothetical protein J7K15_09795, partial [Deltaproteobacteria bacterium]|nr:hypothetical protein [Deltaproteobacteria bacterium]